MLDEVIGLVTNSGSWWVPALVMTLCAGFLTLLVISIIYPLLGYRNREATVNMHTPKLTLGNLDRPMYKKSRWHWTSAAGMKKYWPMRWRRAIRKQNMY
ncbi:hypothetical protein MKQ70_19285 [Chitinophaga sedimenti]|uniref:hypothetical protein n=1 Tax=Chitinophaga sedimenti TaxID=2033606 RepID=UPI002006D1A9|nr:hypothetical protein [Chitinophaga sedimenti]MCK7557032.1 hypothetical protein [Chitinophaga sedimenti]